MFTCEKNNSKRLKLYTVYIAVAKKIEQVVLDSKDDKNYNK